MAALELESLWRCKIVVSSVNKFVEAGIEILKTLIFQRLLQEQTQEASATIVCTQI